MQSVHVLCSGERSYTSQRALMYSRAVVSCGQLCIDVARLGIYSEDICLL